MKVNDILMKKWCFGTGRTKVNQREEAVMNHKGELQTYVTYPKYRTIALKVVEAKRNPKNKTQWLVEANQYASLNAKPKKVSLVLNEHSSGLLYIAGQKRPFLKMGDISITEEGLPPVGSLITVDKKHAIVTATGRNELTVFVNNKLKTISCKPGTIKWHSDKILASLG